MALLFVGEERSELAKQMGVTWKDGRLAAAQLFDALNHCGIDPAQVEFTNWFERGGKKAVREWGGTVVAMGRKVQRELTSRGIDHVAIAHPAARGAIRRKEVYCEHVREALEGLT